MVKESFKSMSFPFLWKYLTLRYADEETRSISGQKLETLLCHVQNRDNETQINNVIS